MDICDLRGWTLAQWWDLDRYERAALLARQRMRHRARKRQAAEAKEARDAQPKRKSKRR